MAAGSTEWADADVRLAFVTACAPADAVRYRVDDPDLATALGSAGARLEGEKPEVEIGDAAGLSGAASVVLVPLSAAEPGSRHRALRGVGRLAAAARLEASVLRARRRLQRLGYADPALVSWGRSSAVAGPGARRSASDRLLLQRVMVGSRRASRTFVDEALAQAAHLAGEAIEPERMAFASSGVVVLVGRRYVLRVGLGAARRRIDGHVAAVRAIMAVAAETVAARVPTIVATGPVGIGGWSLESRLAGDPQGPTPSNAFLQDCLEVLRDLGGIEPPIGLETHTVVASAGVVAEVCDGAAADRIRALAHVVADDLAEESLAFSHGDFWSGNLLQQDGRLVGVLDWASCGRRHAWIDALHLDLSLEAEASGRSLGSVVAGRLATHEPVREPVVSQFVTGVAGEAARARPESLLLACWLDAAARDLLDPDTLLRGRALDRWRRATVQPVLAAVEHAFLTR